MKKTNSQTIFLIYYNKNKKFRKKSVCSFFVMYNNSINGVGGGGLNTDLNEALNPTNTNSQMLGLDQQQQLDNLSNLLINSWETDDAALEQYESEMDRTLNDNLLNEKEQSNQRLFQSFQTSACAVAQMFKDKQSSVQQSPQLSSWQSFQNSAGAITVLYKDSLEACRVHMDLGVCIGQQRKLKEIINWIKKKKKRTIRKDELISFLIGKQYTNTNQNQMFNLFSQTNNSNANNSGLSSNLISTANNMSLSSSQQTQQQQTQATQQPFFMAPNRRQQSLTRQQQHQLGRANSNTTTNTSSLTASTVGLALNTNGENSSGSNDSQAVETNSDLATFREALIMHSKFCLFASNRSSIWFHFEL